LGIYTLSRKTMPFRQSENILCFRVRARVVRLGLAELYVLVKRVFEQV